MTKYRVVIELDLLEDLKNLDWLFQAVQDLLEEGETMPVAKWRVVDEKA